MSQHMDALARANEVRLGRAALKRELRGLDEHAAREQLAAWLAAPPEHLASWTVFAALQALHRWGRTRALRALATLELTETQTVGGLTARQRYTVVHWLLHGELPQATQTIAERMPNQDVAAIVTQRFQAALAEHRRHVRPRNGQHPQALRMPR